MRPPEASQYQNCSSPGRTPGRTSSRSGTKKPPAAIHVEGGRDGGV